MKCYMPVTGIVRIIYTLQYTPKTFYFPKTTTESYLQQAILDIIEMMKYPLKTLPLFHYVNATKNAINQIDHILQRITSQACLQNLPLHPMLPQSQNENIQHQQIISTSAPAPRVKTQELEPIPPPIEKCNGTWN